jgi:response regulator RpfG family c-di-GMP phosphodiesterase
MDTKHAILYLDDEEQNLIAFQALLRKDYKVFTTADAHEATEILSRENIAVIFSDQKMPEVSGVEFFENIIHEYPTPVRILLTGHADIEAVIDAINKGQVYRYVSKPWEVGDLKICIENAIEKYQRDADLVHKKNKLVKTQSDLALVTTINLVYQILTQRLTKKMSANDYASIQHHIQGLQLLSELNEYLIQINVSQEHHIDTLRFTHSNLPARVYRYCETLHTDATTEETQFNGDEKTHFSQSACLAALITLATITELSEEKKKIPTVELIENKEKSLVKIQVESPSGYTEKEIESVEKLVRHVESYLISHKGSVHFENTPSTTLRITFESHFP